LVSWVWSKRSHRDLADLFRQVKFRLALVLIMDQEPAAAVFHLPADFPAGQACVQRHQHGAYLGQCMDQGDIGRLVCEQQADVGAGPDAQR